MENQKSETRNYKSILSRRDFLKLGGAAAAAGAAALAAQQSGRPPQSTPAAAAGEESLVLTTCALCPSGCGLEVRVAGGRAVKVEGNPLHPLNQGVCCLKGQTSLEILYSPERLQHPRVQMGARGSGDWREISWEEALTTVAAKLAGLREQGQAHSVALVHGETRGQMRALLQRFMTVFGSPNLISTESLGLAAARLAMLLSQGINGLPTYDLTNTNYILAFGGNLLESSRNVIANLGALAFMRRGRPQRGKLVSIHPRLGLTGVKADEWVPVRPGTYAALALGMANVIINSKLYDEAFVRDFTFGFEDFKDAGGKLHLGFKRLVSEQYPLDRVAKVTGLPTETIARLAGEFAANRPSVAVLPLEAGELTSGNGLYTALAVHALNALVGSIDCRGGVLVQRFPPAAGWPDTPVDESAQLTLQAERLDGAGTSSYPLAASIYQNLPESILARRPYPVNALFLYNANPVYELPDPAKTVEALLQVPFVVSFASTLDETAAHADLILPASTFLETWGDDYLEGTGYAGVSLRRPVVEPVLDSRDPGDVILEIARRLGGPVAEAFPWKDYPELVRFRLGAIDMDWEKFASNGSWSELVYFNAAPGSQAWSQVVGRDRLNAPQDGRFDFFSRELHAALQGAGVQEDETFDLRCLPHFEIPTSLAEEGLAQEYPLLLVSQGLITQETQWQGIVPTLQEAYGLQVNTKWSSWVEINPTLAAELGLREGDLVEVESPYGRVEAPIRVYAGLWPSAVFLPPGLGHITLVGWGRGSAGHGPVGANPNLLRPTGNEPISGLAITEPVRVKITKK